MKSLKWSIISIIISIMSMLFFSYENTMNISPVICIVVNIVLIILMIMVTKLSYDIREGSVAPLTLKRRKIICVVLGTICFFLVLISKILKK